MDRQTDGQMDIWDCRVAFTTEKHYAFWNFPKPSDEDMTEKKC